MSTAARTGKVIIAGAGPGDPDLLTVKAMHAIQQADVILVDRLVNREILQRYGRKDALLIEVGKQAGRKGSRTQDEICEWMALLAEEGNLVLRLKGGDVGVFSNVLDELQTLKEKNIPFELIPGVSAGLGGAAYAGIPLTARNHTAGVRFLTYNDPEKVEPAEWTSWAKSTDTLVFYMAVIHRDSLLKNLLNHGMPADMPLVLIEQATTPLQQVHLSTLGSAIGEWAERETVSPSMMIIGRVAALHQDFQWFRSTPSGLSFFEPLGDEQFPVPHFLTIHQLNQVPYVAGS